MKKLTLVFAAIELFLYNNAMKKSADLSQGKESKDIRKLEQVEKNQGNRRCFFDVATGKIVFL